jgi:hypothetical protein
MKLNGPTALAAALELHRRFSWSTSKAQARPKPVAESQRGPEGGGERGETVSAEPLFRSF